MVEKEKGKQNVEAELELEANQHVNEQLKNENVQKEMENAGKEKEDSIETQKAADIAGQEAADKYCTRDIDKSKFEYRKKISNVNEKARESALKQLQKRKDEIQRHQDLALPGRKRTGLRLRLLP